MEHPGRIDGWLRVTLLVVMTGIALIALPLVYVSLHPNALKPVASYLTERLLGRTLVIDGEVSLELSLQPRVSVENARFANAAGSPYPEMARAGYLLVQIDLIELFNRRVRLLDLVVHDGELILENPLDGKPNWSFSDGDGQGADWSFLLEGLAVEDSTLRLELGELEPMVFEIPHLLESTDATGYLTVEGEGRFNGRPWQVRGRLGTFDELLAAGRIDLQMGLSVDEVALAVSGSIGNLAARSDVDLTLTLNGPDADLFGTVFRMPEAFAGDVSLAASIHPDDDGHRLMIDGHVSQFAVEAKGTVRDLAGFDGWDGEVDISGPDAGVFARALQLSGLPGGPFEIRGGVHRDGGDLDLKDVHVSFSGARLTLSADFHDFPDPSGARVDARLTGDDLGHYRTFLRLPELPDGLPFRIDLALNAQAGAADALTAAITIGSHTLDATGVIGPYPEFDDTRLTLSAAGQDIAELARVAGREIRLSGPYRARTELTLSAGGLTASASRLEMEPLTLTGTLRVADLRQPDRLAVEGSIDAADSARIGRLLGLEALRSGPLSLSATVSSDGRRWHLKQATGRLTGLTASATGVLGPLPSLAGIDLQVKLEGTNINRIFDRSLPGGDEIPFSLVSRVRGADGAIELEGFELHAQGGELRLDSRITFEDDYVGSRITLTGHGLNLAHVIPSFPAYRPPEHPWKIGGTLRVPSAGNLEITDGSLQMGSVQATASGVIDVRNQQQTDLSLTVSGDAIDDLGEIGALNWPELPFSISTDLDGSTNAISISRFDARWGASDLQATGSMELTGKPRIVLKGSSSLLKISEIRGTIAGDEEALAERRPDRVIPDTPIPLDFLARQDLDVTIDAQRFEGLRVNLTDVDVAVRIQDGALHLDRIRYRDQDGFFDTSGTLQPEAATGAARLVLNVKGKDADLGIFVAPDQPKDTRPSYNLDIAMQGSGTTVAEIAGNLEGTILVWSDGGRISNSIIQTYASDFLVNVLDTLNPFTKSEPFTQVQCLVLNAGIEQGRVNLQPGFVMRTANLNMFVVGDVNLRTERLNLSLATQARQGIGISAATLTNPYFKVGGTLAAPALQLDAQSAAIAASVTAATAGLSIVVRGVWSRLRGEQNPCPQFLNYKRE